MLIKEYYYNGTNYLFNTDNDELVISNKDLIQLIADSFIESLNKAYDSNNAPTLSFNLMSVATDGKEHVHYKLNFGITSVIENIHNSETKEKINNFTRTVSIFILIELAKWED